MTSDTSQIGNRAWSFAHVLRDDGLSYLAYIEQITFLLFLKMADEVARLPYNRKPIVPPELGWQSLLDRDGADLIFFDKKPGREKPWTSKLWVYDLRTNMHFTLKKKPIRREDFDEFVQCFKPGERQKRRATWSEKKPEGRWRAFTYDDLLKRDKVSLDLLPQVQKTAEAC